MEDIIKQAGNHLGYDAIKPEQLKVVLHFLKGKDCFVILPTGYGKSLCFALLPLVFNTLRSTSSSIVIFVTPLNIGGKIFMKAKNVENNIIM